MNPKNLLEKLHPIIQRYFIDWAVGPIGLRAAGNFHCAWHGLRP